MYNVRKFIEFHHRKQILLIAVNKFKNIFINQLNNLFYIKYIFFEYLRYKG